MYPPLFLSRGALTGLFKIGTIFWMEGFWAEKTIFLYPPCFLSRRAIMVGGKMVYNWRLLGLKSPADESAAVL
jgi:hypothetical protein